MMTQREALSILGLEENVAVLEDVKSAYRAKAKLLHPDKGGDVTKFKRLVEAYKFLTRRTKVQSRVWTATSYEVHYSDTVAYTWAATTGY